MSELDATPTARSDLAQRALIAACFAAGSLALIGPMAAVVRYTTGLMPWTALALAAVAFGALGVVLWRRAGRASPLDGVVLSLTLVVAAWVVRDAMRLPGFDDLATIGGGDAGNHLAIASAWATTLPRIYLGFTGEHALLFAIDHALRHDLVHALSDVHRVGLWSGLVAVAIAGWGVIRGPTPRAWRLRWLLAAAPLTLAWVLLRHTLADTTMLLGHYLQVEGFFPHAFALAPLGWTMVAAVWLRPWWLRTAGLALGIVLVRFTYGLQLGDVLLACAAALALDASRAPTRRQRWLQGLGALVCAGGSVVALATLWGRRLKSGGVQHFDTGLTLEALSLLSLPFMGLLLAGVWAARRAERPESPGEERGGVEAGATNRRPPSATQRVAWMALAFVTPSVAMLLATGDLPEPERGYYLWKYPMTPLMLLSALAPFACAAILAQALRAPAGRRALLLLLAGLCSVATIQGAEHTPRANPYVAETWRERGDETRPLKRLHPLLDRHVLRFIDREVSRRGHRLAAFVHNKWPAFNATMSAATMWRPQPIERAPQLQMQRYPAFLRGAQPATGACVAWMETRARMKAVLRSQAPEGAALRSWLPHWRQHPRRRCETYTPHWAKEIERRQGPTPPRKPPEPLEERVCVLCGPV